MALLTGCIYGLRDPRNSLYRYVGQTMNPDCRKNQHQNYHWQGNVEKARWQHDLESVKMKPEFVVLEKIENEYPIAPVLLSRERYWCNKLANEGHPLTNRPIGQITKHDLVSESQVLAWMNMISELRENWMHLSSEITRTIGRKYFANESTKAETAMLRAKTRLDDVLFDMQRRAK